MTLRQNQRNQTVLGTFNPALNCSFSSHHNLWKPGLEWRRRVQPGFFYFRNASILLFCRLSFQSNKVALRNFCSIFLTHVWHDYFLITNLSWHHGRCHIQHFCKPLCRIGGPKNDHYLWKPNNHHTDMWLTWSNSWIVSGPLNSLWNGLKMV